MDFDKGVLGPVREYVGNRSVRVPSGALWAARSEARAIVLSVTMNADALCRNLQAPLPASPSFLWCLAYWLERATGRSVVCEVNVTGAAPDGGDSLRHWRRSQFLLQEYASVLGARFRCNPAPSWSWPSDPVLNAPRVVRGSKLKAKALSEHNLEVQIADSLAVLNGFREVVPSFDRFRRQFPLGLFEGTVSKASAWTPGGASQADLWGTSDDGRVLHLFELKTAGNTPLGIVPETFYYARLLDQVRRPLPDGRWIVGQGEGYELARQAQEIVVWLIAPALHPLVYSRSDSPLRWLNEALVSRGLGFRVLPFSLDQGGALEWRRNESWPPSQPNQQLHRQPGATTPSA